MHWSTAGQISGIGEEEITTVPAQKFTSKQKYSKTTLRAIPDTIRGTTIIGIFFLFTAKFHLHYNVWGGKGQEHPHLPSSSPSSCLPKRARTKKLSPCFPVCPQPTHPQFSSPLPETALGAAKGTRIMLLRETFFSLSLLCSLGNYVVELELQ